MNTVYWIGNDGNIYGKSANWEGVRNLGMAGGVVNEGRRVLHPNGVTTLLPLANFIANPGNPQDGGADFGGGAAAEPDPDAAMRDKLRGEIGLRGKDIQAIYDALFGDLNTLLKERQGQLEEQYGGQLKKAGEQYAEAIPQIETSYAAIGAGDSTDNTYAKVGAKKGFEDTTETIGKNKQEDLSKLGQYGKEQRAKFEADWRSAKRNVARAGETTDVDALRAMRNDLESNLDTARVTRSTLGTDKGARGELSKITSDNGRFKAAQDALDSIIKSSLSGGVKQAAVQAISDSAGLSDEEKKKIQETYGNVYAEQAAL